MKKYIRILCTAVLSTVFMMSFLYCLAEEKSSLTKLMQEAKVCIEQGNKEKAVQALDIAFESANLAGDCEVLIEIGDLYISIDASLGEKAMKAWTAAGHWKCQ